MSTSGRRVLGEKGYIWIVFFQMFKVKLWPFHVCFRVVRVAHEMFSCLRFGCDGSGFGGHGKCREDLSLINYSGYVSFSAS